MDEWMGLYSLRGGRLTRVGDAGQGWSFTAGNGSRHLKLGEVVEVAWCLQTQSRHHISSTAHSHFFHSHSRIKQPLHTGQVKYID